MKVTAKVAGYEIRDVIRSRWLIGYTLFFLVIPMRSSDSAVAVRRRCSVS